MSGTSSNAKALPQPWLRTARLALREMTLADLDDLYALDRDPRVMRFIAAGGTQSRDDVASRLARVVRMYPSYPGLGAWRADRLDSGAFVGWFTLKYVPRTVEVEVGYRLRPQVWGRGYATEGAAALVRHGFEGLGLDRIIGITHPDNVASQRVLLKCGLKDRGWGRYYDKRLRLFIAQRDNGTAR